MEKTPEGTSVGVDDPYDYVERCDHVTDDGRCRYAIQRASRRDAGQSSGQGPRGADPDTRFVRALRDHDYACPVVSEESEAQSASEMASGASNDPRAGPDWEWADCPHFRCRNRSRECVRCGLEEVRMAHSDERPLLEEHHLSYRLGEDDELTHEITVYLCRWCHAKVHDSWARIDDDAAPDPEAIAAREERRSREAEELGFESAADRYE